MPCGHCSAVDAHYVCDGCRKTEYCSTKCQEDAWELHEVACNRSDVKFTIDDAKRVIVLLGVSSVITPERLLVGMHAEREEHGSRDPKLDVGADDPIISAKIALAHFKENPGSVSLGIPDYYSIYESAENIGDSLWGARTKPSVFTESE